MANAIFLNSVEKLRANYWFIPSVMVSLAILLSFAMTSIDAWLGSNWSGKIIWLHANDPQGARALLATISGSMITVASVTFSMTITSVSYATGQIGPRLIGNFMRDRANQVTLGTFVATFIYCLLVLRTIVGTGEPTADGTAHAAFVPHLAIMVGILFALASVAILIFFFHHIPESINVSNIIARVGHDLLRGIDNLFPNMMGQSQAQASLIQSKKLPDHFFENAKPVCCAENGYIQVLDENALIGIATKNNLILRIEYRPGDFCTKGDLLLYAYPKQDITDDIAKECHACFAFGQERTHGQDVLFLVDELVEIIARALSPGVNDPFTAISAMDWLQCALQDMASRQVPDSNRYDENKDLRIVAHPINFEIFCSTVFGKTLPYVAADRNAALRTMKVLGEIIFKTPEPRYREILIDHAKELKDACLATLPQKSDRQLLQTRFEEIQQALTDDNHLFLLKNSTGWLGGTA